MDKVKITILEDGTIKTETDAVSMPNHSNAEKFLLEIGRLAGGDIERKAKTGHAQHSHDAGQSWHASH
jgi:hypothetical protein